MRVLSLLLLIAVMMIPFELAAGADKGRSDDEIYNTVKQKLAVDPEVQGGAFDIDVKAGVVTIKGVVEKDKFKEKATKIAKKVKGVNSVDNQLRIGPRGVPPPK